MITFILFGDVSANVGPANVHRELISHWPVGGFIASLVQYGFQIPERGCCIRAV